MSPQRDPIHNSTKQLKFLVSRKTTTKFSDVFILFLKSVSLVFTIALLFSPLFYLTFPTQSQWYNFRCPQFYKRLSFTTQKKFNSASIDTNLSHIVFGISGSAETWNNRRFYSELWWKHNITRGYVWLDVNPQENITWPETSPPYKISSDTSNFTYTCSYGSRSALRIARIVKETFELGLDDVRWFVMGDDDTVFFVDNLITVLQKYDHNQMYYIGGNSESVEQDVIHSYTMAYGGGGFAISYSLAAELVNVLDGCIDRYAEFYGSDQKVDGCIREIGVPLTKELGFHQIDIRGNPYGLLAAHPLAPLVSLHHLDYVDTIFPGMTQIDSLKRLISAYNLDPGRALQHSFCYDLNRTWSVSVSWGYTVQIYPSLMTAMDLQTALQTFRTWRSWSDEPFAFNTRPVSPDPCERAVVYFLDGVESGNGSRSLTRYKRQVEESCNRTEYAAVLDVDFLNVTASALNPEIWKLAPRRQCCEVIMEGGDIKVNIRGCNLNESVTPSP